MNASETVDESQRQPEAKNVATKADVASLGQPAQPMTSSLSDEGAPVPTSEPPQGSPSSEPTSPPSPGQGDDELWEEYRPRGKVNHTVTTGSKGSIKLEGTKLGGTKR